MYGSEVSDQLIILRSREVMSPCTMSGTSSGTVLLVHPDGHAVQDANGIAWMAIIMTPVIVAGKCDSWVKLWRMKASCDTA